MVGLSELRDARTLAHRLSSECRGSPYRPLAAKLRSLRNVLEDIEDTVDDAGATESAQSHLVECITHTKMVLGQLAVAVQQTVDSPGQDSVSGSPSPAVFHNLLEDTTSKLAQASEDSSVSALGKPEATIVQAKDEPSAATPHEADVHNLRDDPLVQSRWSYIYLDPLSAPIEQATSIILGDEPDPQPRARGMSMRSERDLPVPSPSLSPSPSPADDRDSSSNPPRDLSADVPSPNGSSAWDRAAEAPELSRIANTSEKPTSRDLSSKTLPPLPHRQPPLPPRRAPPLPASARSSASSRDSSDRKAVTSSRYRIVNPDPESDAPPSPLIDLPSAPPPTITLPVSETPQIVIDTSALDLRHAHEPASSPPIVLVTEHTETSPHASIPENNPDASVPAESTSSLVADAPQPARSVDLTTTRRRSSSEHIAAGNIAVESSTWVDSSESRSTLTLDVKSHRSSSMPAQPPHEALLQSSNQSGESLTSSTHRRNRSQSDLVTTTAHPRVSLDTLNSAKLEQQFTRRPKTEVYGFYGTNVQPAPWHPVKVDNDAASQMTQDLKRERSHQIVESWNRCHWDVAEQYLTAQLSNLMDTGERLAERRTRHLLGVCASFQGQSSKAIAYFLSVLRVPVLDVDELDVGDCAAAYWLADEYALLNRRAEALLAYSIAERSPLYQEVSNTRLSQCVWAERRNCLRGVGRNDFKQYLVVDGSFTAPGGPPGASLLEPATIGPTAARALLDVDLRKSTNTFVPTFELDPTKSRAATLSALHSAAQGVPSTRYYGIKITADMLYPDSYWPMAYDPFYCSANVARGRLLLNESDMLRVFTTVPDAKLPRSGPLDVSRKDCFSCNDLAWLISAIRVCLRLLGMEWSEVANVEGTWFVVRYVFVEQLVRVATTHYFTISLFRHSFRPGYGCEICPEGSMSASRIIGTDASFQRGVPVAEPKRIRRLMRELLDEQAKQRPKSKRQSGFGAFGGTAETLRRD